MKIQNLGKNMLNRFVPARLKITQGVKGGLMESKSSFDWKDMCQIDKQLQENGFNSNKPTNSNKSEFEDALWGTRLPGCL